MLSPQAALICAIVVAAGCDGEITRQEIDRIGELVDHLPIFRAIGRRQVAGLAAVCSERLAAPDGMEEMYAQIRAALSQRLREAPYALSCDVIAADPRPPQERTQALERIRTQLEIEAAAARTIERAARLRAATV